MPYKVNEDLELENEFFTKVFLPDAKDSYNFLSEDSRIWFSTRLRAMRKHVRRITQEGLADICGIPSGLISDFEDGSLLPSLHQLVQLAKALECTSDFLLGVSGSYLPELSPFPQDSLYWNVKRLSFDDMKLAEDIIQMIANNHEAMEIINSHKEEQKYIEQCNKQEMVKWNGFGYPNEVNK